jgi:hypothetical protein
VLSDNRQLAGRDLGVVIFERGETALICHFALYGLLIGFAKTSQETRRKPRVVFDAAKNRSMRLRAR